MIFKLRGRLLATLLMIIGATLLFTFSYAATTKVKAKSGPKAFFPETEFNAGELLEGENLVHTFTVINKGDDVLRIIKVRPG